MKSFDYCIIIPTVGLGDAIGQSFPLYVENAEPNTLFVLSVNPYQKSEAERIIEYCKNVFDSQHKEGCELEILWEETTIGFGESVNKAYNYVVDSDIDYKYIGICNDDLGVPNNWQKNLSSALETKHFVVDSSIDIRRPISELNAKVGAVGPVSRGVYNEQKQVFKDGNLPPLNVMAAKIKETRDGIYIPTTFLSGFCLFLTKECATDLANQEDSYSGIFDTKTYPIGGYEDNDLSERLTNLGYRGLIAHDVYVEHHAHTTLDKVFPGSKRGMENRVNHYLKYESQTQGYQKIIGAYRVSIKTINELNQLKTSLVKSSMVIDGAAILLTNDPSDALGSYDARLIEKIPETDVEFFLNCQSEEDKAKVLEDWANDLISKIKKDFPENNSTSFDIKVESWGGEFNERDERNRTHEMAEELGADWIFSIDADEFFEDRIDRYTLQKYVTHPDPSIKLLDVGFLNHWESESLIRTDWPFCTGYKQSMCGPRLFKVMKKTPMRIFGGSEQGLHCGNSPQYGLYARRESGVRMRHLSHVRSADRDAKFRFYQETDKDKNPALIGFNDYSHIAKREDVPVSAYKRDNGIGLFMLAYEKEIPFGISNIFSEHYNLCDRLILVWTGEWDEEDTKWCDIGPEEWPSQENWRETYKTGPGWDLAHYIRLFKVELLHEKFNEDLGLSHVRNYAIDYLRKSNNGAIGWGLFLDPDEMYHGESEWQQNSHQRSIRRMAEINDTWAWLFNFINPIKGANNPASSDSIRMFRLDPQGIMRLSGRVHESFNKSLDFIKSSGVAPKVKIAPFKCLNMGLFGDPETMGEKLIKYQNMLIKEIEDDSLNSGAWLSLALQYMNDGISDNAETCFERACMTARGAYLPFKEMGILKLREAFVFFTKCLNRLNSAHPYYRPAMEMVSTLQKLSPPIPQIDTGDIKPSKKLPLPDFPYDRIAIDVNGEFVVLPEGYNDGEKVQPKGDGHKDRVEGEGCAHMVMEKHEEIFEVSPS